MSVAVQQQQQYNPLRVWRVIENIYRASDPGDVHYRQELRSWAHSVLAEIPAGFWSMVKPVNRW